MHRYMRDNGRLAWKAVSAIEQGDARELGRAMAAAQVRACVWEEEGLGSRCGGPLLEGMVVLVGADGSRFGFLPLV